MALADWAEEINLEFDIPEKLKDLDLESMGLIADSLDMLADALVYALALFAVGKSTTHKRGVTKASGYFQLVLALLGLGEVIRRFFSPWGPTP